MIVTRDRPRAGVHATGVGPGKQASVFSSAPPFPIGRGAFQSWIIDRMPRDPTGLQEKQAA